MKTFSKFWWVVLAPCILLAGCGKGTPSGSSEAVSLLSSTLTTGASAAAAHVDIAGVTKEEEVSIIDLLHVSGLLTRGTQQVAIINGNVVSMGEEMHIDANGRIYKLRVLSISDESIKLIAKQDLMP